MTWEAFDFFVHRMDKDLEAIEQKFEKIYAKLLSRIVRVVKSNVLDKLELRDDGTIPLSPDNVALLTKLNKIIPTINVADLIAESSSLLMTVADVSSPYFAALTEDAEKIKNLKKDMLPALQRRAKVFNNLSPARKDAVKMRQSLIKDIAKGGFFKDIMKDLKQSPLRGTRLSHAKTELRDVFMEGDRMIAHNIAEEVGLSEYYRYTGGLVQRSRDFCEERNRKVFTRKEVLSWKKASWQGKSTPYDPFIKVGGYNCRHRLMPISEEMYNRVKGIKGVIADIPKTTDPTPINVVKSINKYESELNVKIDRNVFGYVSRDVKLDTPVVPPGVIAPGAHFNSVSKTVRIPVDDRRRGSKWWSEAVFYHEFGHAADDRLGLRTDKDLITLRNRYKRAFGKDRSAKYRDLHTKLIDLKFKAVRENSADTLEKVGAVADTLMSLNPRYGWGHGKSYMKKEGLSEAEFIAHAFENTFAGNDLFKSLMPDLYEDMITWVKGVKP